jgi:rhamnogalacturonyl hydrolase YesR
LRGSQIQVVKEMIYLDAQIQAAEAKLFPTQVDDEEAGEYDDTSANAQFMVALA